MALAKAFAAVTEGAQINRSAPGTALAPADPGNGLAPRRRRGHRPALVHRIGRSASLDSGFAHNVGRLRACALRPPGACPKIAPATFPVERSGDFFIQVQKKKGST
jgi:hypothetical protein